MRKQLLGFLFLSLFYLPVWAQTKEAQQVDEFENIPCDEYLMRMDAAMVKSQENPLSKLHVMIYEGKEGIYNPRKNKMELGLPSVGSAKAKFDSIKDYAATRNFPVEKFVFVEAGFRENLTVEIWLVPLGAALPEPTPTLNKMKYRKGKPRRFCIDCCGL